MNRFNIDNIYIVAEIGQNHNGDMEIAKALIDEASMAGCSAVKLAKRDLDHELTTEAYNRPYNHDRSFGETYGQHRKFLELSFEDHKRLKKFANNRKMDYFLSVCDIPSLEFALSLDPPLVKIPSKEINNLPLIEKTAECGKPVAFSIGMATSEEYNIVQNILKRPDDITVLTTSSYPTEYDDINLNRLTRIDGKKGFSCHNPDPTLAVAAVALGATYIEYHITLDREMKGSDHICSLELEEMTYLVDIINNLEIAMGDYQLPDELSYDVIKNKKRLGKVECEDGIYRIP